MSRLPTRSESEAPRPRTGVVEVNFDGIIGPTHNYAGLSEGNLASQQHRLAESNPREAALQGLAKMKYLADLGVPQAVLPPHERPSLQALRRLGFSGSDQAVVEHAARSAPMLLAACYSASAMWAANAATVSPSADTADGRVHFTPANLASQFHRSLEAPTTAAILKAIFPDKSRFAHHDPLPISPRIGDEGAANHTRLTDAHGKPGLELFVFGRGGFEVGTGLPERFPARQTREASEAVARLHQLEAGRTLFIRQNPAAIDAGAFHNDVVAVGNENVLLYHASAFAESAGAIAAIKKSYSPGNEKELHLIEVPETEVPLADAVRSYLFNSQLVTTQDGMALICPHECQENAASRGFLERLTHLATPIKQVHFINVRQSMHNGGGPACLRLRVVLNEGELATTTPGIFLTDELYATLCAWVTRHYRTSVHPDDLADPLLIKESRDALDELTRMLRLPAIYAFQRV